MNITFQQISLRNFLSYGNNTTVVDFSNIGTTLIMGENLDDTSEGTSGNGTGKAQPLYSWVKTPTGWTTIGECKVGDYVSTPDGNSAMVTGVFPQGLRATYSLTFQDGRSTEADEEHMWEVFSPTWGENGNGCSRVLTTKQLIPLIEEREHNVGSIDIFVPTITHSKSMQPYNKLIPPYLLGRLLGEICICDNSIVINTAKSQSLGGISVLLQQHTNYGGQSTNYSDIVTAEENCSHTLLSIASQLSEFGLSHTSCIPDDYLINYNYEQKLELLQGLMDTVGTVGESNTIGFCSSNHQLALKVQYLIRSIGGIATILETFILNLPTGPILYNTNIQVPNPSVLFTLPDKLEKLSVGYDDCAILGLQIHSIKYVGLTETQCIMVDSPEHLYITDSFIVTHNTSILNALTYALYDKPVSNITKDKLINNINNKNMEVATTFIVGEDVCTIKRERKSKNGNNVYFTINGEDKTLDSVANTNKLIEEVIGIPYDLFVRIVVFSATLNPFLDLPKAEQAGMFERLVGLTILADKAVALKELIKDTETNLKIKKSRLEMVQQEHARHDTHISNTIDRIKKWDTTNTSKIQELDNQLSKINGIDLDEQRRLHEELTTVANQIVATFAVFERTEVTISTNGIQLVTLNSDLDHLKSNKCPYCLQDYKDAMAKIDELTVNIAKLEQENSQLINELDELDHTIELLEIKQANIQPLLASTNIKDLLYIQSQSATIEATIAALLEGTNPYIETLEELQQFQLESIDFEEVNVLTKELEHQKLLLKLLTKRDSFVRKMLLNNYIPYLNTRLHYYLSELLLRHTVEFTHEMTASISQFGNSLDFGNLSAGQRARVNIALSLAFSDVLQKLHTKVNVWMLDEVLDVGLDAVGIQAASKLIKRRAKEEELTTYIISHREEVKNTFDHTMTIQMKQGFSYIAD